METSQGLQILLTAIVAVATVAYAGLTYVIVKETIKLREAQTEPEVVLFLQSDLRSPIFINIIVRNIGPGVAYDLAWSFDTSAQLITERGVELPKMRFFQGVRYFAPGQEYKSFFASSVDLLREPIPAPYEIGLYFKSRTGKVYTRSFIIDVGEFYGRSWIGDDPTVEIAEGITKIKKTLEEVTSGWHRAKVDVYDSADRAEERQQRVDRLAHLKKGPDQPPAAQPPHKPTS